ncbi:hypothetical protein [Xanthobacter tagetidis]|jgi:uncharacterized membrane protein YecN with MAPEG domain|uniref:hypothetical protein n=1 Tax=Xanthobacter tagetidis TaxID=60216 RepID=UPI0014742D42|nr:hypothetical protein [Xanthobacter tagetidis]MBB6307761.1 putative membrane protein YecN with MAPEG domain [Xanthobacter tagetidis]
MNAAQLLTDYVKAIDIIALLALAALAVAAFYRRENWWLWLLGIVVIAWVAGRLLGPF